MMVGEELLPVRSEAEVGPGRGENPCVEVVRWTQR